MPITKLVETQIDTETSAGSATSISAATCVRLYNNTSGIVTVGVNTLVGSASTIFFAIPPGGVEFLSKMPTDVIWSSSSIKANKVAFTN
jgi:hypothetical protein